ncbi:MAG: diguanylate cyclase [Clostridia bacterium]|nr:diguanylate cyclase [Clostridia bacterium]
MKSNKVNEVLKFRDAQAFEEELTAVLAGESTEENVVTALLDMDNLMPINEKYGNDAGDDILIAIGQHFENGTKGKAEVFRIRGDEFAVLFRGDMEKEDVFLLMEQLRAAMAIKTPAGEKVTVSIGIASAFEDATRYQELFRKAESAMFRAKYSGQNRVALCREEKMVPKTSHYTSDQLKRLSKLSKREGIGEAVLLREALDMLLKRYDV